MEDYYEKILEKGIYPATWYITCCFPYRMRQQRRWNREHGRRKRYCQHCEYRGYRFPGELQSVCYGYVGDESLQQRSDVSASCGAGSEPELCTDAGRFHYDRG